MRNCHRRGPLKRKWLSLILSGTRICSTKPLYTREQLDNANEQQFLQMQRRMNLRGRRSEYVIGIHGKPVLRYDRMRPVNPNCWKIYQEEKKKRQKSGLLMSSVGDNEVEAMPSAPVDILAGGLNDTTPGLEGPPSGPLDVGTEVKEELQGSLADDPLDVAIGGEPWVEGSLPDDPLGVGNEGEEELDGPLSDDLDVPAAVSEYAGLGGKVVVDSSPSDLFDEDMSLEKAILGKAEEKLPHKKKRKLIVRSPGHISIKKKIGRDIVVISQGKKVVALLRVIKEEMATLRKELQTTMKKVSNILNPDGHEN